MRRLKKETTVDYEELLSNFLNSDAKELTTLVYSTVHIVVLSSN